MTGRDLIIYILKNHLEDQEVFEGGKILGLLSVGQAAEKFNVGEETVKCWFAIGQIDGVAIGKEIYIFPDAKPERKTR